MQAPTLNASRAVAVAPCARVTRPVVRLSRQGGSSAARVALRVATRSTAAPAVETAPVDTVSNGNGNGNGMAQKGSARQLIKVRSLNQGVRWASPNSKELFLNFKFVQGIRECLNILQRALLQFSCQWCSSSSSKAQAQQSRHAQSIPRGRLHN